jgi:molybdopterin-containing oxidoreductase family iron-sulfur binding subunit
MKPSRSAIDLDAIRARLEQSKGPAYWRSLEQLAETEEFQAFLHKEFPQHVEDIKANPVSRRNFLKLMGASLALAGATACTRQPTELVVPYVQPPEEIVPGKPLFFASSFSLGGVATGILVESHMGRPTKIEGNPEHPASLGATDVFAQAAILTMYDPDRSQSIIRRGRISTYDAFLAELAQALTDQAAKNGAGIRLLTETVTSPTLGHQIRGFLEKFPRAQWCQYEPVNRDNAREGARMAFGQYMTARYHVENADVILSLDGDFLTTGPGAVRYAREFAARRDAAGGLDRLNRLYVVESIPSLTGAIADHRLGRRPGDIEGVVRMVASALGVPVSAPSAGDDSVSRWVAAAVSDLRQHAGASLVVAGDHQPPAVHALAHAMNETLGNVGKTVTYTDPIEVQPVHQTESLRALVQDMNAGSVDLLVIVGGNPVFTAPADLDFAAAMDKAALRVHLGLYHDETAELCHWHIPQAHPLEAWGDGRAYDGTITMNQPLIAPLYGGRSEHELLSVLAGSPNKPGYEIVRAYWQTTGMQMVGATQPFETFWKTAIHDGFIAHSALPAREVRVNMAALAGAGDAAGDAGSTVLLFMPDPTLWDGRYANNGWLQELPKPLTKLTWDNAALIGPRMAQQLGVENTDLVELSYQGRSVRAPIWILPGHPDNTVTVHLGYGRRRAGRVGDGTGFNAYAIRPSDTPWFGSGLQVRKVNDAYPIYSTQDHHDMDLKGLGGLSRERHLVRMATVEEYREDPGLIHEMGEDPPPELTLYPRDHEYDGPNAWGMVIDLNKCNGCNACTIACQAENNISVVGKDQVANGREMHWIRIDRYYRGDLDDPETYHQPVPCMQCENAPCELVCPVGATVHSKEGLNDMVYNRCVGTRYCSNNCPYKVRRFNFYLYADFETPSLQMARNPDVTVRSRGVMEKCTYCVQRINWARIEAKKEDRNIRDGEILTACQQACPTQAITFGNVRDPNSRVSKLKTSPLNYGMLTDLNTKPRTTYLARILNPNPAVADRGVASNE